MNFERAKGLVLRRARALGVDVQGLATSTRRMTLAASGGRVDEICHANTGGVGVRVVTDGRFGYASSEALDDASLGWMLDEAIGNAGLQAAGGADRPPAAPSGAPT